MLEQDEAGLLLKSLKYYAITGTVYLCGVIYRNVLQPLWMYVGVWFSESSSYAQVQWFNPGVQWVKDKLPERSFFVDDSDTELRDFLPSGEQSPAEYSGEEGNISSRPLSRKHSHESLPEDEQDLVRGLKFPTIEGSDTSDEEFSLRSRVTKKRVHRKTVPRSELRKVSEKSASSKKVVPKRPKRTIEESDLMPVFKDEDFEILQ